MLEWANEAPTFISLIFLEHVSINLVSMLSYQSNSNTPFTILGYITRKDDIICIKDSLIATSKL